MDRDVELPSVLSLSPDDDDDAVDNAATALRIFRMMTSACGSILVPGGKVIAYIYIERGLRPSSDVSDRGRVTTPPPVPVLLVLLPLILLL